MSEARIMLVKALQRITAKEVALRCGVSTSQVSRWVSGEQKPSKDVRLKLEIDMKIPKDLW